MKFTVEYKDDKVILHLELPKPYRNPETLMTENRSIARDNHALDYLNKSNIKVGGMLKSGKNDNLEPPYFSQWIFEKSSDKPLKIEEKNDSLLDKSLKPMVSSTKKKSRRKTTTSKDLNETE